MFTFKIRGASEAQAVIASGWPTCVVSVIQESAEWKPAGPHHLVVHMSDVFSPKMSRDAPSADHLKTILAHTAKLTKHDRLLVNCWAGQSRSTAAALAILIQHGCDPQTAFDKVLEARDVALPNGLLVQHIDDHFKLGGALVEIVTAHRKSELAKPYIVQQKPAVEEVDEIKRLMMLLAGK